MNSNERAYELLRWQSLAPLEDYREDMDYSAVWKEFSDRALNLFDEEQATGSSPELTAFRELERLGHYTQDDFFSPSRAAQGFYVKELKRVKGMGGDERQRGTPKVQSEPDSIGSGKPTGRPDAESKGFGDRPRLKPRNPRW